MSSKPRATTVKKPQEPRNARSSPAVRRALRGESVSHEPLLSFTRTNYLLMAAGAVLAIIGFVLLRGGDINLAARAVDSERNRHKAPGGKCLGMILRQEALVRLSFHSARATHLSPSLCAPARAE